MPHLTLVEKESNRTHRIEANEALVGRDPACAVCVEGDLARTVSGRHARFILDDGKWLIEDAGSRNGTYIGTRKLEPGLRHPLTAGEVIGLGQMGTQLVVEEVVGRALAATMLEPAPAVPPPASLAGGTVPMRRSEAVRAGVIHAGGDQIHLTLRNAQSNTVLAGHGDKITIGRSLECIIRVEGEGATSVSRVHAEVSVSGGKAVLRDGGSRHGTYLNGKKIDGATVIKTGDVMMLGHGGPSYAVEDVRLDDLPQAPSPALAPAPTPASREAGDADDGVFRSEVPTPPLGRPAARGGSQPAASARRTTVSKKSTLNGSRRELAWKVVTGILIVAAVIVAVIFGANRYAGRAPGPADAPPADSSKAAR